MRSSTLYVGRHLTLIELATAVALVAVLAAIAIPLLADARIKARYAEVYPNLEGLFDATLAYAHAKEDLTVVGDWGPDVTDGALGDTLHPWSESLGLFGLVGWRPEGHVRARYIWHTEGDSSYTHCELMVGNGGSGDSGFQLYVLAVSDVDDDNQLAQAARCEARLAGWYSTDCFGLTCKMDGLDRY